MVTELQQYTGHLDYVKKRSMRFINPLLYRIPLKRISKIVIVSEQSNQFMKYLLFHSAHF